MWTRVLICCAGDSEPSEIVNPLKVVFRGTVLARGSTAYVRIAKWFIIQRKVKRRVSPRSQQWYFSSSGDRGGIGLLISVWNMSSLHLYRVQVCFSHSDLMSSPHLSSALSSPGAHTSCSFCLGPSPLCPHFILHHSCFCCLQEAFSSLSLHLLITPHITLTAP